MKSLLITYLLAYGGSVLSLFDPFLGLLVYVCFAIIRPEFLWFWSVGFGNNFSRIVAGALLLGWLLAIVRGGVSSQSFRFGRGGLPIYCLVLALVWSFLSAMQAQNQELAWAFVELLFKIVLPCVIGMCLIETTAQLKMLAWVIMVSQGYVAMEMNVSYFQGYNRLYFDGVCGMDNNSASIAFVTCLGLAFFFGLYAERRWQQAIAFACAAFLGHAVLFAFSRGGQLAMIITAIVAFLLMRKTMGHSLAFMLAIVIGLQLAGPEVRNRFLTVFADPDTRDSSAQSRLDMWSACGDVMQRMPFFGAGPNHWPLLAESYGFDAGKEAHSLWLQWGAEMGVPGLAFLALFYATCIWRLWPLARGRCRVCDPWLGYLACMVIAALIGFAVSAQFVSLKLLEVPYYVALLGAGTLKLTPAPSAPVRLMPATMIAVPEAV